MIEGLKITVDGTELKTLCHGRADHHRDRAMAYEVQIKSMEAAAVEGMAYTNGDPIRNLTDKLKQHREDADEMTFIADHIDTTESYILDRQDLKRLGITRDGYY